MEVSEGAPSGAPTRVVGIGASAGGVEALLKVVASLPAGLSAAVCIVLHLPPTGRSVLAEILDRASETHVAAARHGEPLVAGRVYVAPPDRHLLVHDGHLALSRGPKVNGVRPSVDMLLQTLALAYGELGVAVVLSGALGDGSAGALAVSAAGGEVFIQDPQEAVVPSMPERALAAVDGAATVLRATEIGAALAGLPALEPRQEEVRPMPAPDVDPATDEPGARPEGPPSGFTCPECGGAIWERAEGREVRYRCRVGHTYSEEAMLTEQAGHVESALWTALEVLEERAELLRKVAGRQNGADREPLRRRFDAAAEDALARAQLLRSALAANAGGADAFALADHGGE
jgi:two-component system chemotaxis response regulator CheB